MVPKNTKLARPVRLQSILAAALDASERKGYNKVTRADIAKVAAMTPSLVAYYLGPMHALRQQVMQEAVRQERLAIVAQGIALRDPVAMQAPALLRQAAVSHMSK